MYTYTDSKVRCICFKYAERECEYFSHLATTTIYKMIQGLEYDIKRDVRRCTKADCSCKPTTFTLLICNLYTVCFVVPGSADAGNHSHNKARQLILQSDYAQQALMFEVVQTLRC